MRKDANGWNLKEEFRFGMTENSVLNVGTMTGGAATVATVFTGAELIEPPNDPYDRPDLLGALVYLALFGCVLWVGCHAFMKTALLTRWILTKSSKR
ncbi:hypothetical protein OAA10_00360 [bacterium]|nr:hypothetical protein [bacterium]